MANSHLVHHTHRVYAKRYWSDEWNLEDYTRAERVVWSCAPRMGEATLTTRYGRIMQADQKTFDLYTAPVALDHYFVKIEVDQPDDVTPNPWCWYGVTIEDSYSHDGGRPDAADARTPSGTRTITCAALEWLLDRNEVATSVVARRDGAEQTVGRAITFNAGAGDNLSSGAQLSGNKGTTGELGVKVFCAAGATPSVWDAFEIVKYLLAYHGPKNDSGLASIPFRLNETDVARSLEHFKPILRAEGKTVFELLNQLIDRRRLLGWKLDVITELGGIGGIQPIFPHYVSIQLFTFNRDAIVLSDGELLSGNADAVTWDFDDLAEYRSAVTHHVHSRRYDRVTMRGERVGIVQTIGDSTGTLEADWTSAEETLYEAGGPATGSDRSEKQQQRTDYRTTDVVKRVYRYFRLPQTTEDAIIDGAAEPLWYHGLRISPTLPLLESHDYSGSKIVDGNVTNTVPPGAVPGFLAPMVFLKDNANRYHLVETAAAAVNNEESFDLNFSLSVKIQPHTPGLIIAVHAGDVIEQHAIALNAEFTAADSDDIRQLGDNPIDWHDFEATVYFELDHRAEETYPAIVTASDVPKTLLLDAPGRDLIWVAEDTVVGVDNAGALKTVAEGGYLVDDREELADLARVAYEWYSQTRLQLEMTVHRLYIAFDIGWLVTTIGYGDTETDVNSVVTSLAADLRAGTLTIQTEFADLDVLSI